MKLTLFELPDLKDCQALVSHAKKNGVLSSRLSLCLKRIIVICFYDVLLAQIVFSMQQSRSLLELAENQNKLCDRICDKERHEFSEHFVHT